MCTLQMLSLSVSLLMMCERAAILSARLASSQQTRAAEEHGNRRDVQRHGPFHNLSHVVNDDHAPCTHQKHTSQLPSHTKPHPSQRQGSVFYCRCLGPGTGA
jgi:hypothetical protein